MAHHDMKHSLAVAFGAKRKLNGRETGHLGRDWPNRDIAVRIMLGGTSARM
jgi:hypothetical protein